MMTDPAADDRILVDDARRGSRDAIGALIEPYSPGLFRYLIHISGDPVLAEDLLQDTWLRVMERLDSYRQGCPFGNWLFAIARNRAFDVLRQRSRRLQSESAGAAERPANPAEEVPDPRSSVLEDLAETDLARCVRKDSFIMDLESGPVSLRPGLLPGAPSRLIDALQSSFATPP